MSLPMRASRSATLSLSKPTCSCALSSSFCCIAWLACRFSSSAHFRTSSAPPVADRISGSATSALGGAARTAVVDDVSASASLSAAVATDTASSLSPAIESVSSLMQEKSVSCDALLPSWSCHRAQRAITIYESCHRAQRAITISESCHRAPVP